jgi:hypothetical protein
MVSKGLPPLHLSLSDHFVALSASFTSPSGQPAPTQSAPRKPDRSSGLKIPAAQPAVQKQIPSPVSPAVGFMAQHENFHSFLMTMLSTFTNKVKTRPEFPVAQVDDPFFVPGAYCLNANRIQRYDDGWKQLHTFTKQEVAPFPTLTGEFVHFKLV